MITVATGSVRELYGLSTDTKPNNDDIPNGCILYCMDTKEVFMYNVDTKTWVKQ